MHVTYLSWFRQTQFCQADKMHVTYLCWANVEGEETAAEKEEKVGGVGL